MGRGATIIAGEFKREKLGRVPSDLPVRPILARIKKSLFDILKIRIADSVFLDLFAGSGSVGLEAMSRGAKKVVFVEMNPACQRWIQKTLSKLSAGHGPEFGGRAQVVRADVMSGLAWLNDRFDLIFCGAPYVDQHKKALFFVEPVLEMILRDGIVQKGGWFIAQHHHKETFKTPEGWNFFRQERYGDTMLSFFEFK